MRLSKHTRVFGLLFLVLALLMLPKSWITSTTVKSRYYDDTEDALEEMEDFFEDMEWILYWCGIDVDFNYDEYAEILKDVSDGISAKEFEALSRWEISVMFDMIGGIFSAAKEYEFDADLFDIGDIFELIGDMCEESELFRGSMLLILLTPVYFIAFWAFVVCGVIALYKRFKGYSSPSEMITFAAAIVMTVIMLVYITTVKSMYKELDEDIAVKIGLTLIPFLTIALAMPSSLLDRLPISRINLGFIPDDALDNLSDKSSAKFHEIKDKVILPKEEVSPVVKTEYKSCRVCGAQMLAANEYCTKCGAKQSVAAVPETPPQPTRPTPPTPPTPTPATTQSETATDGWFSRGSDL